jgi:hypothetical protein
MIVMHMAYGLDLIALAMGTGLLVWSIKNPGKGSMLGKIFGTLVMAFSLISMLCMFSCSMRGGECRPGHGEGMMMGPPPPPGEMGPGRDHDRMPKKMMEHNKKAQ